MVVRGGNGRLGRVAAMLRKWNRPVITLMNRAVSVPLRGFRGLQGGGGTTEVCASGVSVSVPLRGFRGLQGVVIAGTDGDEKIGVSVPLRGFRGLQSYDGLLGPVA